MDKVVIGGQAVIEGVMMRCKDLYAVAVRAPSGEIEIEKREAVSLRDRYKFFDFPFVRGAVSLFESLIIGIKALNFSAQAAGEEEEKLTDRDLAITLVVAFIIAGALFVGLPTYAAHFASVYTEDSFWLNTVEGAVRLFLFLAYIAAISALKDIRRVFMYHGAEHKTIFCFENNLPLTVENVRPQKRFHPRCGTSFLFLVVIISTVIFAFTGWPDLVTRILSRLALLPVIAGVSYEILKLTARYQNGFTSALAAPGLWLQYLTTREPTDDMIEVAIASVQAVLPPDEG